MRKGQNKKISGPSKKEKSRQGIVSKSRGRPQNEPEDLYYDEVSLLALLL